MIEITREYLRENPDHIFVYGDNLLHRGKAGAAALRDEPNTLGFITKKYPNNDDSSFYRPEEYKELFQHQLLLLETYISKETGYTFLISQIGSGLANRYNIWEEIIEPGLQSLKKYSNVKFLWC